jgi:hypothetical protein
MALAQANGWDVTTVRILTVIGFFFSSGLIGVAYVAAWIGIPEDTAPFPNSYSGPYPGSNQGSFTGANPGPNPGAYPPKI